MLVNAARFLVVALAALCLQARRRAARAELGHADRLRDGIVSLFRERTLALVLVLVKRNLHVSDFGHGFIFACWTVGMTVGSLVVARCVRPAALAAGALVAVGVQSAGLGLPTAWLVIPFGCAMWFVGGLGHRTKNVRPAR
jgi:hypothetical protein